MRRGATGRLGSGAVGVLFARRRRAGDVRALGAAVALRLDGRHCRRRPPSTCLAAIASSDAGGPPENAREDRCHLSICLSYWAPNIIYF